MQDFVLILSRCEKEVKGVYIFHFKGFYSGIRLEKLEVFPQSTELLELNHNYLLWGKKLDIIENVLRVKLIKYKKLL